MNSQSILAKIQEVFRAELDDDNLVIDRSTVADDIADWDSLAHVRLIAAIEREFGFEFELSQIEEMVSVGDFADAVARHVG